VLCHWVFASGPSDKLAATLTYGPEVELRSPTEL
jgi:hypothetical protein